MMLEEPNKDAIRLYNLIKAGMNNQEQCQVFIESLTTKPKKIRMVGMDYGAAEKRTRRDYPMIFRQPKK